MKRQERFFSGKQAYLHDILGGGKLPVTVLSEADAVDILSRLLSREIPQDGPRDTLRDEALVLITSPAYFEASEDERRTWREAKISEHRPGLLGL